MMDKAPDAYRTITEVAEDLDLPQHVLRFWETRFGQIKPLKRGGGRRYYRPDDVDLLRGIRALLYRDGFTIKGVQRILREQGIKAVQAIGRATLPGGEGEAAAGGLEAAAYGAPTQEALAQKPRFVDSGPEDRGDFDVDDGEDFPADADVSIPPPMPVVPRREAPAPPAGRIHAPIPRPEPAAPAGAASQAVPALPVAPAISEALTWPAVPAESGEDDGDAPALPAAPVRPEPPPAIARRTPERGETPDLFGYSSSGPAAPGPAGVGQVSIVRGGLPRKPIVLAPASPDPLSAGSQVPDPQFPDDSPHPASLSHEEEVPAPVERRGAEAGAWQADRPDLRAEINALAGAFREIVTRYRVFAPPAEG